MAGFYFRTLTLWKREGRADIDSGGGGGPTSGLGGGALGTMPLGGA